MTDATDLVHNYRECARGLWNTFLRGKAEPYKDFDAIDRFSRISTLLIEELVLRPLGVSTFAKTNEDEPYPFFSLQPIVESFPVMVARPSTSGRYWDDPISRLSSKGVLLLFIDFFDWDRFGYIDFQYYRVEIAKCDEHPQIIGRQALVDVHHARIIFEEARPH